MTSVREPVRYLEPLYTEAGFVWHDDCRHFEGGMPCKHWRPCQGCNHYDPIERRVLIVMLRRHGDLLIASPLPGRVKRDNPSTHITWLVDEEHAPVVRMNPYVDRILCLDWQTATQLPSETFDAVYSFERKPHAAALVDRISATEKAGLAHGGTNNTLYAIGEPAKHFFKLNTWNDYRTQRNTKTWTELYFEVAGYTYDEEPYALDVPSDILHRVEQSLGDSTQPRVCLNIGGSRPTKLWPAGHWLELGRALLDRGYQLIITGGPDDQNTCEQLHNELRAGDSDDRVRYRPLTIEEFAAIPAFCIMVVTGDTFGYHLALAHNRPCILLLGPSSSTEVVPRHDTNTTALRSSLPCSPCANQIACGGVGGCMDTITPARVLAAINEKIGQPPTGQASEGRTSDR